MGPNVPKSKFTTKNHVLYPFVTLERSDLKLILKNRVQEYGEILSAVVKIQMHPDYNPFTFEADLAVVELAQTIDFDQYKQPIALG